MSTLRIRVQRNHVGSLEKYKLFGVKYRTMQCYTRRGIVWSFHVISLESSHLCL